MLCMQAEAIEWATKKLAQQAERYNRFTSICRELEALHMKGLVASFGSTAQAPPNHSGNVRAHIAADPADGLNNAGNARASGHAGLSSQTLSAAIASTSVVPTPTKRIRLLMQELLNMQVWWW
jgi:hypothetical protein